jgi:hypothetical protein
VLTKVCTIPQAKLFAILDEVLAEDDLEDVPFKACRISSPVGSVTRIRHPHLSGPDELWRELRAWIERENGRLHFGFLHLRQSEEKRTPELSFGEMLFHHGLDPRWLKHATQYVGSRADMYEAYLTGGDKDSVGHNYAP